MNRKSFLKALGAAGAATLTGGKAEAVAADDAQPDAGEFIGVLVDTTRCIGCRSCELACAGARGLQRPDLDEATLTPTRTTSETQWTVVSRHDTDAGEVFVKRQCMHCWQPACAAACLTNAMCKTREGPVVWKSDKCMGCRFCMVSCPFGVPKFEYGEWNPSIQKCNMCWERLVEGQMPACVQSCPADALLFGTRRELMEIARVRIYNHPDRYVHHVYGGHEVGGCSWLYLAAVPFEQLGFRTDLGTIPYPEYTRDFLQTVPVALFGLPALLVGLNLLSRKETGPGATEGGEHDT